MLNRRQLLSLPVAGALSAVGCSQKRTAASVPGAGIPGAGIPGAGIPGANRVALEGSELTPVVVDPALEIRTITGLRPYRAAGFVVRKEERGSKTLIHNYGHGGGGMSLSWGSAHLAVQLAQPVAGKSCAVIGGGVMGLSTARLLQLQGAQVTLYAETLPPHTTSNVAGAQWWPVSVFQPAQATEAFRAQFVEAAQFAFRYFQNLVGPRWGVRWLPNYFLSDDPPMNGGMSGPGSILEHMQVNFRDFGPGEHIFPAKYLRRFHTMLIEPAIYLAALLEAVQSAGARVEVRRFRDASDILLLPHFTVFNCTGLGARHLFNDEELEPIKGQLTFLLPQPQVNYNLLSGSLYMFPRTDGILLGGSYEKGQWNLAIDAATRERTLAGHAALFANMAAARP